jgi:two-component system cell cycle sensor histidine kinase/response regulator CckA
MKSSAKKTELLVTDQERDVFFTHSFDLMGVVGTDGYFKRINPAVVRALGYTEEELLAQPLSAFLHPDDVPKTQDGIQILAKGDARLGSINRYRCKDGTYKWFSWNTKPIGDHLFTIGRDITDQVDAEAQIRKLNRELEEKNENLEFKIQARLIELREKESQVQQLQKLDAIGQLAGGIAHDFNNILGAIQLYCDLMSVDLAKTEVLLDSLQQIEKSTERGAALTRQLLIFSRKKVVELKPVHLNQLLIDHFEMLSRLIGANFTLESKLANEIPLISADPSQIEQVVMNLVINAKDSMPADGRIHIETRTEILSNRGSHVVLTVSDSGCGMDVATKARIFEPFFTTKPTGKGIGLGLATVYGIVQSLNGTINVESEIAKGTTIKIYIPAADEKPQAEQKKNEARPLKGNETILLVEDEASLRKVFGDVLKRHGYKVLLAENGRVGLQIFEQNSSTIDLIVTDMIMPELNGDVLAREILARNSKVQVLFMSGYPGENSDGQILDDQRTAYLQKPFNAPSLMAKMRELLDSN